MFPYIYLWSNYKLDESALDKGLYLVNTQTGFIEYEVTSQQNKFQLKVVKTKGSDARYDDGYIEKYRLTSYMARE